MKFPAHIIGMLAIGVIMLMAGPLRAQDAPDDGGATSDDDGSASFQTFYDSLGNQGTWIQSGDYGYVWQPTVNDPDWAPYTDGSWVYSDDGWTWASDEPWGWATYHYGRWANIDGTGWCWVPGYVWAPAWVSWRYGDGYCGWAPLPPDSFVGIDYGDDAYFSSLGFHIGGDCDGFFGIGAGWYNFVPVGCLGYRNYHGYYVNRHNNFALINHTTNVTNINFARNSRSNFHGVTMGGPSLAQVNAVSQTPVQRVNLVRASQPGGGTVANKSLALFAPHVSSQASPTARPGFVSHSIPRAEINRGTDITRPLAVNQRLAPSAPTTQQIQQAQLAQAGAPASAKVMTAATPFKPPLNTPLTSFKPIRVTSGIRNQPGSSEVHGNPGFNPGVVAQPGSTPSFNRPPGVPTHVYENPSMIHSSTPYTPQPGNPSFAPGTGIPHNSGPGMVPSGGGGYQHAPSNSGGSQQTSNGGGNGGGGSGNGNNGGGGGGGNHGGNGQQHGH